MSEKSWDYLLQEIARGKDGAFDELYEGMKRGVFALAYSYLRSYADAEDAVQETFLAIKRKANLYRRGTNARAWVFQIAKNIALDELRRRKRRAETEFAEEQAVEPNLPYLDELTATLTEEEREIVIMHAVWGYKHKEIAKEKGLPLGTVTWKYNEAIKKLRKEIEKP
jgi:RNA polymerase sigma-70 factor (ECF subfamily)